MQILVFLLFLTYFTYPFQLFAVGTYGFTLIDLNYILLYSLFLKRVFWDGVKLQFSLNSVLIFFLLFIVAVFISAINPVMSSSPLMINQYLKTTSHFIYLILFIFICFSYPISNKIWTNVIRTWIVLGGLINIFGIYQIVARAYDLPLAWLDYSNVSLASRMDLQFYDIKQLSMAYGDFFRATSIFPEPSALGMFNTYLFLFIFVPYVQGRKQFIRSSWLNGVFFSLMIAGSLLTFSMTGFVGIMLVILAAFLFERSRKLVSSIKFIALGLIVIIITDYYVSGYSGISVVELFSRRISGLIHQGKKQEYTWGESFEVRKQGAELSYRVWEDYPITGIGLGLTGYNKKHEITFSDFSITQALSETGIIGASSFAGLFFASFLLSYWYLKKKKFISILNDEDRRLAGLLFYLMIVMLIMNFISGNNLVVMYFWIPYGMIVSSLNNMLIQADYKVYEFSVTKIPLKEHLKVKLKKYIESVNGTNE